MHCLLLSPALYMPLAIANPYAFPRDPVSLLDGWMNETRHGLTVQASENSGKTLRFLAKATPDTKVNILVQFGYISNSGEQRKVSRSTLQIWHARVAVRKPACTSGEAYGYS